MRAFFRASHMRGTIWPCDLKNMKYLCKLRPSPQMVAWNRNYDEGGRWKFVACLLASTRLQGVAGGTKRGKAGLALTRAAASAPLAHSLMHRRRAQPALATRFCVVFF
jgi:hypothetical protein